VQPQPIPRPASVAEVKEALTAVLDSKAFRQAPRLGKLLQYMCGKALLDAPGQVTEYTIAVDVFGKPPDFKESNDSSVRVEVYRLRKRLAQFYETEGAGQPVRIVIPPGQYVPEFQVHGAAAGPPPASEPPPAEVVPTEEPAPAVQPAPPAPPAPAAIPVPIPAGTVAGGVRGRIFSFGQRRMWLIGTVATAIILAAWIGHRIASPGAAVPAVRPETPARAPSAGRTAAGAPASVPLRILAGYGGQPHIDASGFLWQPDQYFQGGRPWQSTATTALRTNDPLLFQHWRSGEFSYHIPLAPGTYELHLYFAYNGHDFEPEGAENVGTFSLDFNGERIIPALDVESDAMGQNTADERVFKDVHPGPDGMLGINLEGVRGMPFLNALEVLPGIPHKQNPVRLVAQPRSFVDHAGQLWRPDNYYLNGEAVRRTATVVGSPDPGLFAGERYGHFAYAIPADVHGRYTVTLYFAEAYFGPDMLGQGGIGSRVFNVMGNGVMLAENLDIFKEAGSLHALKKSFTHIKPSAQGKINLTFEPVENYALVNAIEVLDESQ
jgi:hypothetical protein